MWWAILFVVIGGAVLVGGLLGWAMNQSMLHAKENDTRNIIFGVTVVFFFSLPLVVSIVFRIIRSYKSDA